MCSAGVIRPIPSKWSFVVVTGAKKHGKPRFYINDRLFNMNMKATRWPTPKPHAIFDEYKGSR